MDILLVSVETFDRIFAESGAWTVGRAEFRVPSLPHLIALKLHAMRNDPAREARDLADVLALLQANPGAVSEDELARLCRRYGPTGIAEKMRKRP